MVSVRPGCRSKWTKPIPELGGDARGTHPCLSHSPAAQPTSLKLANAALISSFLCAILKDGVEKNLGKRVPSFPLRMLEVDLSFVLHSLSLSMLSGTCVSFLLLQFCIPPLNPP